MKTHKIMTIDACGIVFECIMHFDDTETPYWLYYTDGKHLRLVDKFDNRPSVLACVMDFMNFGTL